MAIGTVQVELNIEEQFINELLYLKRKFKQYASLPMGHHENQMYRDQMAGIIGSFIRKLNILKGLEAREPGKGKFVEVKEINRIIKEFKQMNIAIMMRDLAKIDRIIGDLRKLKQMELRLG